MAFSNAIIGVGSEASNITQGQNTAFERRLKLAQQAQEQQRIALESRRQNILDAAEKQRLGIEEQRTNLESQRLQHEIEQHKRAGWIIIKQDLIDNEGNAHVVMARPETQELKDIKLPGLTKFQRPSSSDQRLETAKALVRAQGIDPDTPEGAKKVTEIYSPSGAKIEFHEGGSGSGGGAGDIPDYVEELKNGDITLSQIPSKIRGEVLNQLHRGGGSVPRKLTEGEKRTQDAINTISPMVNDLRTYITSNHLENDNGIIAPRRAWIEYNILKKEPSDPVRGPLVMMSAALQVIPITAWSGIRSSKYTFDAIVKHLPNPEDSPKLLMDKINFLQNTIVAHQQEMLNTARGGEQPGVSGSQKKMTPEEADKVLRDNGVIK